MIHVSFRYVKSEHVGDVVAWLNEVNTVRRSDAVTTLITEGVRHETAHLIDTTDGPILVYAMETDDIEHARAVGEVSLADVDRRHKAVMRTADNGPVPVRALLDLYP